MIALYGSEENLGKEFTFSAPDGTAYTMTGCKTIFDVPPAFLSPKSGEELRKALL